MMGRRIRGKRVAVTGVTGAVGMALLETCVREGCEVLAVCRRGSERNSRILDRPGIVAVEADLCELDTLVPPDDRPCETFYHLDLLNSIYHGTKYSVFLTHSLFLFYSFFKFLEVIRSISRGCK